MSIFSANSCGQILIPKVRLVADHMSSYPHSMAEEADQSKVCEAEIAEAIRSEVDNILQSPSFQRSAVLTRLLLYLVKMTIEGRTVKAFEIAIDGLGKSESDSVDSDNYARVVVARLRRALSTYYSTANHERVLHIDPGSYVVRIDTIDPALATEANGFAFRSKPFSNRQFLLVGLILIATALLSWLKWSQDNRGNWTVSNFPTVQAVSTPGIAEPKLDECLKQMTTALGGYTGVRLVEESDQAADYRVEFASSNQGEAGHTIVRLVNRPSSRILWSKKIRDDPSCIDSHEMKQIAYSIASPGGVIESYSRRQGVDPNTPFGCWLRFTESVKAYNTIGNSELEECAKSWYSDNKSHPVAALLYSWTLVDVAAVKARELDRKRALEKALDIASQSSLMNSEFASLHIARMRIFSFLGARQGAVTAARRALDTAQENPVIVGMAASSLALWNEPDGERILLKLRRDQVVHMPWESVGLFIAAMMRDDTINAGAQVEELAAYDQGQPVLRLLQAAYLARSGNRKQADYKLHQLESDRRIWIAGSDKVIDRLPMAPEVKARLRQWLANDNGSDPD